MLSMKSVVSSAAGLGVVAAGLMVWSGGWADTRRPMAKEQGRVVSARIGTEQALKSYANLPVTFIENRGQTDKRVRYYAQGPHYAFYLTRSEAVVSLVKGAMSGSTPVRQSARRGDEPILAHTAPAKKSLQAGVALHLRFLDSNPHVEVKGEERAPGEVHYLQGNDPAQWHTGVSRYARVAYHELWPGVDLKLYEQGKGLKYEFRVRPGARVSDIRLAYKGATGLTLDAAGGLQIQTALGVVRDAPPVSYQEIDGARVPVESHYVLQKGSPEEERYGFAMGANYKPDHDLIIDPGLDFSTYLGGASHESGLGIKVDAAGNAYIVGVTQSPNFPTTSGAFDRTGAASNFTDVFVAKLNPTGTALIYSTFIGGSNLDWGRDIAIDAAGSAYITGQTKSSNFPTTSNAFDRIFNFPNTPRGGIDNYDAFVAKLNPSGSALVYSSFLGGAADIDDGLAIAVDASGNAYVTGETGSSDFPIKQGAFRTTRSGVYDTFVTKFNASGSALLYSTFIGGSEVDYGIRIAVDASNNAYVLGSTRSPDFPTTPGAYDTSPNGEFDIFLLKLNSVGSNLIYSTLLGGMNMDSARGLAIDSGGNAYVGGSTASPDFPATPGALKTVSDSNDGFVTKFNPTGSALVYSTLLGGSGDEDVADLVLDASNNAYLTGGTSSLDFPTTPGAAYPVFNGGFGDAYVATLSANGSTLLYATYLGGTNSEGGSGIALGPAGSVYITGQTLSTDFPTTPGALDRVWNGDLQIFWADAFVTRLTPSSVPGPPVLASVTASPSNVIGGNNAAGTVTLSAGAPPGGALVSLSSSNPAVVGVPTSALIPAGATSVGFVASTSAVTGSTNVTVTATYNGVTRTTVLIVSPPPSLQSLTLSPSAVVGGDSSQGIVTLTTAAPAGGAIISLASSNTAIATVPANVTIAAGSTSATFSVNTVSVTASSSVTISGAFGGANSGAALTVTPPITLTAFAISPGTVAGGNTTIGTVTISSAAPAGGFPVTVTSNNSSIAPGPGTGHVTVAQGATSASWAIGTNSVTTSTPVTFTATTGGVSRTATLTVTPPQTATLTVTATGRNGERVTSSPTGISVLVGSTGSASFPIGTTITLSVINGRSAIWSGAASSGGNKTKTITFTLTGNASITANVQ